MSKLYLMNRMAYAPAAGGPLQVVGKFIGGLFRSKAAKAALAAAKAAAKKPLVQTAAMVAAGTAAGQLLEGGGGEEKKSGGASGSWCVRRRRGITATELRGYRKVANLIHKEGMVSKRARGRK